MSQYVVLGELIKTARQRAGLDQGALAAHVGVRQQAISGWERGASRPRFSQLADVCRVLDLEVEAATEAGRYREATVSSTTRLLALPFENLSDEAFEAFCADLFALKDPSAAVSRNGSTGQKQYGVDVFVSGSAGRVGVQCKRREKFGAADVRAVVDELLPEAAVTSGVIALSRRTASASARLEVAHHADWTLYDGEDLSRAVRDLPVDKALKLVDTYFDGLRERFLGVREPSPWLTTSEYDPALPGRLAVDRDFALVGRDDDLRHLENLVSAGSPLVLLVGRGGIGKTRLLRELASEYTDREVRFVRPGPFAPQAFDVLPEGSPVIVVDDATDGEHDLVSLVGGITTCRPGATVVLVARPRSLPHLRAKFEIAELEVGEFTIELGDLPLPAAESLAAEALGESATDERVERLAAVGYDCPFLIVIAAHLIKNGKLSDRDLGTQDALRQVILDRFASIVVSGPKADERTRLLASVSAVQPAPLDDPLFVSVIADLARLDVDRVLTELDELEDLGLILRRGQTVRVVPDLLGDSLLDRALVSQSGIDKGFAARIADRAAGRSLTNAIRNVSIIDWRKRVDGPSELAQVLWSALTKHAIALTNSGRIALGKQVAAVAAVYPMQALELVEGLLANPAPDEEDPMARILGDDSLITTDTVLQSLAMLIANAGHRREHLAHAMSLLLRAGRLDSRRENSSPDHGLRLLRELGEYSSGQDVTFYLTFVESLTALVEAEDDKGVRGQLVDMLKPLLAHEFTVTRFRGVSIAMSRRTVDFGRVAEVRAAAISAATAALTGDPLVATRAIAVLGEGLHSHDRTDDVTEEFAGIVETLRCLLSSSETHPGLRLAAFRALGWHATYGRGARRELVRAARAELLRDDAYLIARQVRSGWDAYEDEDDDEDDDPTDAGSNAVARYHRAEQSNVEAVDDLVERWRLRGEGARLLELVRGAMDDELESGARVTPPDRLLYQLLRGAPDLAQAVVGNRARRTEVDDALVGIALRVLIEIDDANAETLAAGLLDDDLSSALIAASAIINARTPVGGVRESLMRYASTSGHAEVHRILLSAGRWFEPEQARLFLDLLHAAPLESDPRVADAAITVLAYGRELSWTSLPSAERASLLNRLVETPRLPDHELGELLNAEIKENPWVVLNLFKSRVELKGSVEDYDVFPYLKAVGLDFTDAHELPALIDDTVEWILADEGWQRDFYGGQILQVMVGDYGDEAKSLVRRLIASRREDRVRLAQKLLNAAPQRFVIDEREFVMDLLEVAHGLPDELGRHVIAGLHGSSVFGTRSRAVGVDDPDELELRDRGRSIAEGHAAGSPARMFYEDVARFANDRLIEERADDRRLEEPRSW